MPITTSDRIRGNLLGVYGKSFSYFFNNDANNANFKFFSPITDGVDFSCRALSFIAMPIISAAIFVIGIGLEIMMTTILAIYACIYVYDSFNNPTELENVKAGIKNTVESMVQSAQMILGGALGMIVSSIVNLFEFICSSLIACHTAFSAKATQNQPPQGPVFNQG